MTIAEVAFHWYAGTSSSALAVYLRNLYLYKEPNGKQPYAGSVDFICPAITYGIALGMVGAYWPVRRRIICTMLLPIVHVALYPLFDYFIPQGARQTSWGDFVMAYFGSLFICGVVSYGTVPMISYFACMKILKNVLPLWPKVGETTIQNRIHPIRRFLSKNFREGEFVKGVSDRFKATASSYEGRYYYIEFIDLRDQCLHRAYFIQEEDEWRLESISASSTPAQN